MEQSLFNKKIGENLRRLRNIERMTQEELAQIMEMARASIANMETGRQAMSAYQAMRIATALKLQSIEELFDMRLPLDDGSDAKIYRAPEIEERTRSHLSSFISRHDA
jgi:transcriptional regulator with XRE-family HTH domain